MSGFDSIIVVDWSARSTPSPRAPTKDAIFIAETCRETQTTSYCRTRADAMGHLTQRLDTLLACNERVLLGFDFPFAYPCGFGKALTGSQDPFAVWRWLSQAIEDDARNGNNRLDVADAINAKFPQAGPFWSHPTSKSPQHVPFRKPSYDGFPFAERRRVEQAAPGASTCFQLYGNGAVASQTLLGLPHLETLRHRYGPNLSVRPFEEHDTPIVLAEIYPSILSLEIKRRQHPGEVLDAAQTRVLAAAFQGLPEARLNAMLREGDMTEGWIVGLGYQTELVAALS